MQTNRQYRSRQRARNLRFAALALAACALSCGDRGGLGEPEDAPEALSQLAGQADVVTFVDVKANGTGCPPGTANTSISSDGLVFTTTFSSYFIEVNPRTDVGVKDCQLDITLKTPRNISFSVQRFSYSGYALLQDGVVGRQTANYYFQGNPVTPTESNRTELRGPYERSYLFIDDLAPEQLVWSPCGVERNLNVQTRVQVFNGNPRRSGYMNLSSLDGQSKLVLKLATRACDGTTPPPGTGPGPSPSAALVKPTNVVVTPSTVTRDEPFAVSWAAPPENQGARYSVQVRTHQSFGFGLIWESPETDRSSVSYTGPVLPLAGNYHVVVVARRGGQEVPGDLVPLTVRESSGSPSWTPPTPAPSRPGLPGWATSLPGRYALRMQSYWSSARGLIMSVRELALADIVETDEGLEMRAHICSSHSTSLGADLDMTTKRAFPEFRRKIILENGGFRTDATPLGLGYTFEGIAACQGRAGEYIPKLPEQRWIRGGSCRCPYGPSEAPRLDDCRVTDPDGDGRPGYAFEFRSPAGLLNYTAHYVSLVRSQLLSGRVREDGTHTARLKVDQVDYGLACDPSAACADFMGPLRPCTADYNEAQFARLSESQSSWSCASLIAGHGRLFTRSLPSTPSSCVRGVLTDDPNR